MNLLIPATIYHYRKLAIVIFISLFISACATAPESIQYENPVQISLQTVQQNTGNSKGQKVRWGGVITQVINNENDTWIEILSLELNSIGRPTGKRNTSQGRFIAKINQFLDPEVYQEGESLTVVGTLADNVDGKIGDFSYSFPVVSAEGHHLWAKRTYRRYPYINPGYWYYGFHPYWNFGYSYYGFGVRTHYGGYYPYYPFFGHLDRRLDQLSRESRSGTFIPSNNQSWEKDKNRYAMQRQRVRLNQYHVNNNAHPNQVNNHRVNSAQKPANRTSRPSRAPAPRHSNSSGRSKKN